jgi:hypothetical protein
MQPPPSHSASAWCRKLKYRILPWLSRIFAFLRLKPTKTSVLCSWWRLHVLEQSSCLEGCCEEDRRAWGLWVPVASAIEFWVFCCVWGRFGVSVDCVDRSGLPCLSKNWRSACGLVDSSKDCLSWSSCCEGGNCIFIDQVRANFHSFPL